MQKKYVREYMEEHDNYGRIFDEVGDNPPELYHTRDGLTPANAALHYNFIQQTIKDVIYKKVSDNCKNNPTLLEIGSGRGIDAKNIHKIIPDSDITGVEISLTGVRIALRNSSKRLHFLVGDATCLPFPQETFDLIFSHAVLEHVNDPEKMIKESSKVLKKGGVMVVSTAPYEYWKLWLFPKLIVCKALGKHFIAHGVEYSQIKESIESSNCRIIDYDVVSCMLPQNILKYIPNPLFRYVPPIAKRWEKWFKKAGLDKYLYIQIFTAKKNDSPLNSRAHSSLNKKQHTKRTRFLYFLLLCLTLGPFLPLIWIIYTLDKKFKMSF